MNRGEFNRTLSELKAQLKASLKRRLMCLSTTANLNNPNIYFGSIRETETTVAGNIIFTSAEMLPETVNAFDGFVESFLIDVEVKNSISDFAKRTSALVKKSKCHFYKPNDFTVRALDEFVACLIPDLRNSNALIIGAGNIGCKAALSLAERGASVKLYDIAVERTEKIVSVLNLLKRGRGEIILSGEPSADAVNAGLILGCTPGIPGITHKMILNVSRDSIIIDVGNGTLFPDVVEEANRRDLTIYCFSAECGYESFVKLWEQTERMLKSMGRRKLASGLTLITPGILGGLGDIIVNDLDTQERIIGVCDGRGDILSGENAKEFIERLDR